MASIWPRSLRSTRRALAPPALGSACRRPAGATPSARLLGLLRPSAPATPSRDGPGGVVPRPARDPLVTWPRSLRSTRRALAPPALGSACRRPAGATPSARLLGLLRPSAPATPSRDGPGGVVPRPARDPLVTWPRSLRSTWRAPATPSRPGRRGVVPRPARDRKGMACGSGSGNGLAGGGVSRPAWGSEGHGWVYRTPCMRRVMAGASRYMAMPRRMTVVPTMAK